MAGIAATDGATGPGRHAGVEPHVALPEQAFRFLEKRSSRCSVVIQERALRSQQARNMLELVFALDLRDVPLQHSKRCTTAWRRFDASAARMAVAR